MHVFENFFHFMIILFLRFETGFPPAHHQQQILATPTPLEVIKIFFTGFEELLTVFINDIIS